MKKLYIVTSCIQTTQSPLSYSKNRSFFSTEERLKQTFFTINNISCLSPTSDIIILDASEDESHYRNFLSNGIPNCKYLNIRDFCSSEDCDTIRTHKNKSLCESLLLSRFIEKYIVTLSQYEFFFKLSARYFLSNEYIKELKDFESTDTKQTSDKIIFKHPKIWNWLPAWDDFYSLVDLRNKTNSNTLSEYDVRFFGFSIKHLMFFYNMYKTIIVYDKISNGQYSMEVLFYFLSREKEFYIEHKSVRVFGWEGPSGKFLSH